MLNIIFNRGSKDIENVNYVFSPDTYFKYNYEDEWFEDDFVKMWFRMWMVPQSYRHIRLIVRYSESLRQKDFQVV